ncbi:MAG: hypothetical protein ACRC2J_16860 [Microcoleaceae cyanobacterium]
MKLSKKISILVSTSLIMLAQNLPVLAGIHGAQCLNSEGTVKNCKVNVTNSDLSITFDDAKFVADNTTIPIVDISTISTGEYAKKRMKESVAAGILLGPVGGLVGLLYKEQRVQVAIEFVDSQGGNKVTMIDIPEKYSEPLISDLEQTTGLTVKGQYSTPETTN